MPADVHAMARLHEELLESARKKPISRDDIVAIESFYKRILNDENVIYFVCVAGNKIIGQAACSFFLAKPSSQNPAGLAGYIHAISVTATERNKGIGKLLLTALLKYCRALGLGYLTLDATEMGEPLYRSLGFTDTHNVYLEIWKEQLDALDLGD